MRAIVYEQYGAPDVLELREVPEPTPSDDEVLVRVHAASVGAGDLHLLTGRMWAVRLYQGLRRPKRPILGHDVSGVVEAIGPGVTAIAVGDEVFGESANAGAFAELVSVSQATLAPKPSRLTHVEAAAVPTSGLTALQGLRDHGRLRGGHHVLINGASGGVGTFAVQIANAAGARVTAICSAGKADLVKTLGADRILDHAQVDFTELDAAYDLILDNVGDRPLAGCKGVLRGGGRYVAVAGSPLRSLGIALAGGKSATAFIATPNRNDLETLAELVEGGAVRPVVDRTWPLEETADALGHLQAGRARGKLVLIP